MEVICTATYMARRWPNAIGQPILALPFMNAIKEHPTDEPVMTLPRHPLTGGIM